MTKLIDLYYLAKHHNIAVDLFELKSREALSYIENDGSCNIAIDPKKVKNELDEKVKLAHELGHCETGSFYNRWATCDLRAKHECRAERWTIKKLLPEEELRAAIVDCRNRWEIAEIFEVPVMLVDKAVEYYVQKGYSARPSAANECEAR